MGLNSMNDVISAEQTLLAQHDYLQKMETERLVQRHSTDKFNQRRSRIYKKHQNNNKIIDWNDQKKRMQNEIQEKEKKLDSARNVKMPTDKEKRLQILLEIATLEDDVIKLKRNIQNIDKQISRSKKGKNDKQNDKKNDMISK